MNDRKYYLDNIRWITVCLVVVYHIIYVFNCSDVISNIPIESDYPILDSFLVFVYPWFMCLLFVVSGISSRLALSKRTDKEFIKERCSKILIPSIFGTFIYGWLSGFITNQYTDIFDGKGNEVLAKAITDNNLEQYLEFVSVKPGDFVYIPAGTVHDRFRSG